MTKRMLLFLLVSGCLTVTQLGAEEAAAGVAAYWAYRGQDNGREIEHQDVSSVALRQPEYKGSVSAVFYSFQWEADEGSPQHHRDVLLLLDQGRLVGWYNVSGSNSDFSKAKFDGRTLTLPGGAAIVVWPLPPILIEPAQEKDDVEQRFLLHVPAVAASQR